MADLALVTANTARIVGIPIEQLSLPSIEAITAGQAVRIDPTTGKWTKANASDAVEGKVWGIAPASGAVGFGLTVVRQGIIDGYDLSGLDYGDPVYLSDTDGGLADAAGTQRVIVGRVVPGTSTLLGTAYDKLLQIDIQAERDLDSDESRVTVVTDIVAASVDKWLFVADRPYQVLGFEEIHSVVGGSGAVVRPRKVTAAGTDAPGAAAGATVKELTAADIDLTTAINVVQSPALVAIAADLLLATGDKIGLNFGGTLTGLVGTLKAILKPV